jgi:hypothetical protein
MAAVKTVILNDGEELNDFLEIHQIKSYLFSFRFP